MKILLSVFACAPNSGSENGGGWRWAVELARAGHTVVAVTDVTRRAAIEAEIAIRPVAGLDFVYFRPRLLKWVSLNSRTAQLLFSGWQYGLLACVVPLHRVHQFDVAIHLTYGVFRNPSFLGLLGVPFIFGPVGGGEDAPWPMKKQLPIRELIKEVLRTTANKTAKFNPALRIALRSATLILSRTAETTRELPAAVRGKAVVYQEIGIDVSPRSLLSEVRPRKNSDSLQLLFAGRLLGWKGVHLAIRALAQTLDAGYDVHLTIVGSGPLKAWLVQLAVSLGVEECITWHEHMPQSALFDLYDQMHVFLFPSLHDSGGNVVLEALSFGLPVICLDLGGPVTLVDSGCAMVVKASSSSFATVVNELALSIQCLVLDESLRQRMSSAARSRASEMTWASRPAGALRLLEEVMQKS